MSTAQSPVDEVEGLRVGTEPIGAPELCDTCGREITPGDRVGVFFTNTPFSEEFPTPYPFRLHCQFCETDSLFWSPTGYGELLVTAQLTETKIIKDVTAQSYSGKNTGVPYDPVEAFAELIDMPVPFVETEVIPAEDLIAPQDFIYYMFLNGMDPRDAIDMETGEITTDEFDQMKFFETVFMQFTEGLAASLGSHYDSALPDDSDLREDK